MKLREMLLLGCVASWVAYSLLGRRLMAGIDSLTATTVSASVGCLLLGYLKFLPGDLARRQRANASLSS